MKKTVSIIGTTAMFSVIFLNACTTGETFKEKMGRYTPRSNEQNIVPNIKISQFEFKNNKNNRLPASEIASSNEQTFTNKKLYFLSLLDQYESLKKYSTKNDGPKVSLCPNFHTGLITHFEKYNDAYLKQINLKFNYDLQAINEENYLSKHPELYLPLTSDAKIPTVADVIKGKNISNEIEVSTLVQKAIDIHLTKTYFEIKELCDFGTSDNYYIYENLITHTKSGNFTPSASNMNILLKTTIFSNLAIINSLQKQIKKDGRSIASQKSEGNIYSKEIMAKMNVNWSLDYFKNLNN